LYCSAFFFFQAEDGIRDLTVTGVQTCALPICVVEHPPAIVDPETGIVSLCGYAAVDDCGRVLDHTLVEGQIHGGVAQGVGQALKIGRASCRERVWSDGGEQVARKKNW